MSTIDRREFLKRSAVAGATVIGGGALTARSSWGATGRAAKSAGKVYVRQSGGAYQDANKAAIFDPFTKATGIQVIPVDIDSSVMLAQIEQGRPQFDVIDDSEADMVTFHGKGALHTIEYDRLKNFKKSDFPARLRQPWMVGKIYWASTMAYRTDAFPHGPQSWTDFWNMRQFKGPRSLQSADEDLPELEFALLADGVPLERLYPLDVDRAFAALDQIKPNVVKWWDSGAEPGALLATQQVVMASIWNGRAASAIQSGVPIALNWAGARRQVNVWAIPKGAKNVGPAHEFLDFALQPKVQAHLATLIPYGPVSRTAQRLVPESVQKVLPTGPAFDKGFDLDVEWWLANQDAVNARWTKWAVGG